MSGWNHDTTLAADILEVAAGEPIEAIRIDWRTANNSKSDARAIPVELVGKVIPWDQAKPLLEYDYDAGFGGQDCHAFYAWTATRVIYPHEYDGSIEIQSMPRNPVDISPNAENTR